MSKSFEQDRYFVVKNAISKELADFCYSYFINKRMVAKTLIAASHLPAGAQHQHVAVECGQCADGVFVGRGEQGFERRLAGWRLRGYGYLSQRSLRLFRPPPVAPTRPRAVGERLQYAPE